MTELQKRCADFIIGYYKDRQGAALHQESVLSDINQKEFPLNQSRYVFHTLIYKGLLAHSYGFAKEYMFLTDKGWAYESYDKLLADEKTRKDLEEEQIKSVINTNEAVQSNIKTQEGLSNRSLLVAVISVAFIGISAWIQYRDRTAQEVKELRLQLQKTWHTLDSIRLSQRGIDSSLKKIKTDTFWVKPRY